MGKKRFQAEQIIGKLREAEVEVSKGQTIGPCAVRTQVEASTIERDDRLARSLVTAVFWRSRDELGHGADPPTQKHKTVATVLTLRENAAPPNAGR